jgi:alpha-glucosidase (family GH31 glycosyl hydrolase)
MKNITQNLIIFFLSTFAVAQNTERNFISYKQNPLNLEVAASDGSYRIVFYTADIVETTFLPKGEAFNPESHAVILAPNAITPNLKEAKGTIKYFTSGITVEITKSPFQIAYHYNGKKLLSEKTGYGKKANTRDGKPELLETLDFNLSPDEALYGGGARVLGLNRRGNRLQLYNRAHYGYETRAELMNFCIPLVMSSKIYAVHFDNPAIGYLDLDSKKNNTLAYETISGRKTYQVIAGNSWENLIENYTLLTGRQPMPPRWALGNFASRFGYRDQEMATTTARHFKENKIPVDAMIFDLYWFGKTIKGTMGNLEFDKENFPEPQKMLADLNNQGIKPILITEPFILTTSKKWQEAVDKKILATDGKGNPFTYDFYFGNTGIIDIFKPEARNWFWNIYKDLANQGVAGVWGDLGEPEVFPSDALTAKGKADEVHNIYGHEWAKMIYEGYKKDFPNQRPFILMRSGYSGSQRFGMIPWSGDVSRSWGGLSGQPEVALEMGMQGLGYMHSDLGGFAGEYNDNELYLRWLQYGVFQPIFRPHAQELVASEPVYKDIVTMEKAKKLVELRYKMLPYNYTLAFQNHGKGTPLMRPLFFAEPENVALQNNSETYLWGDDFLVTPIKKPGVNAASVYFPKGSRWFDFYDGYKYDGGKTQTVPAPEDHSPVFVRGGAFVPLTRLIAQNTDNYLQTALDIHFYYDESVASSVGQLYLDDGKTPDAFEKGQYELLTFNARVTPADINITVNDKPGKNYPKTDKDYKLYLHNITATPKSAFIGKTKVPIFSIGNGIFYIPVQVNPGDTKIKIEF